MGVNPQGLDQAYALLEADWSVQSRPELGALVVPNGNGGAPVHRWFRMKEAYSCDLLRRVLVATGLRPRSSLTVCDPFCGSGTTAVSLSALVEDGSLENARFVGLENNPYLHFVLPAPNSVRFKLLNGLLNRRPADSDCREAARGHARHRVRRCLLSRTSVLQRGGSRRALASAISHRPRAEPRGIAARHRPRTPLPRVHR